MKQVHIVGCGGIGGWVFSCLLKSPHLLDGHQITFWDKDTVETKNLDRQFFTAKDVGKNKAELFARMLPGSIGKNEWFTEDSQIDEESIIIVCADNNGARNAALIQADARNCIVFIGANETIDAEAYVYLPEWFDTKRDPRVYYPGIIEHDEHDPAKPQCTSHEALAYTPQLAIANMLAASYIMFLWNYWLRELPQLPVETKEYSLYKVNNTMGKIFQTR